MRSILRKIVLILCSYCGNSNVSSLKVGWTFHCHDCDRDLQLFEVSYREQDE